MSTTRPDVQAKRNTAYRKRDAENKRLNATAFELEMRAASIAHTIATLIEEQMRLNVQAALLREKLR